MVQTFEVDLKKELSSDVVGILNQLRFHIDSEQILARLKTMTSEGYRLWGLKDDNQLMALVGWRYYTDLVRDTHLYIDDLVVDEKNQSKGYGKELVDALLVHANSEGVYSYRLCCALENERGAQFYEREGWKKRSYAFVKKVAP